MELAFFFFLHVSRAQCLAPARIRTRVVRLGAQCTDHWTTVQSRGIGVPAVQLTTHVKSSTLYGRSYGRKSKFFRLDGLLLPFCIVIGLWSASSAIIIIIFISSCESMFPLRDVKQPMILITRQSQKVIDQPSLTTVHDV